MSKSSFYQPETIALHSGYAPESEHGSRAVPIYQTTSYVFDSVDSASSLFNVEQGGHIYSRISNPTVAVLEQRLAAPARRVRSNLYCVWNVGFVPQRLLHYVRPADHIVSAAQIYGSTATLLRHTLKRLGIETTFVSINDPEAGSKRDSRQH